MAEQAKRMYELTSHGFDVDTGIAMCAGDEEIYQEVLAAALEEGREKIPFIRECYDKNDMKRYCIEVHGLKNAAKSIGALKLSELAKEQEFAVKENNLSLVKQGIDGLLTEYRKITDAIEEWMNAQ